MIKICIPKFNQSNDSIEHDHQHSLIFDIDKRFSHTTDINAADVVAIVKPPIDQMEEIKNFLYQLGYKGPLLILSIFHASKNLIHDENDPFIKYFNRYFKNTALVHINHAKKNSNIYYDFVWERQRIYFTEYDHHDLSNRMWSYSATKEMYTYDDIKLEKNPKHYLAPVRIHYPIDKFIRSSYRIELKKLLLNYDGYISDFENGKPLETQQKLPQAEYTFSDSTHSFGGGTWWPIHNKYYRNSIASIYVESLIETCEVRVISEKTWDPLIKGHFIIPFAYAGIIADLKNEYNVRFPKWIDYSYDNELNDGIRFNKYLKSVEKFLNTDINTLTQLYNADINILHHNRNLFLTAIPKTVYKQVKRFLKDTKSKPGPEQAAKR